MKKKELLAISTIIGLCLLGIFSICEQPVWALGNTTNGSMILIGGGTYLTNYTPMIFTDEYSTIFNPGPETDNSTATYGYQIINTYGHTGWEIPIRHDYIFTGESLTYYVIVMDGNGIADINTVNMYLTNATDTVLIGPCQNVSEFPNPEDFDIEDYYGAPVTAYDPAIMKSYVCNLSVDTWMKGDYDVFISATDLFSFSANTTDLGELFFNPSISITVSDVVDFGQVVENTVTLSNTVYLQNVDMGYNIGDSGVILDMYISSDPYFDDPLDPLSACPTTAGLPYTALSYYATKGSINSGINNNDYPIFGENSPASCAADASGFTGLTATNGYNLTQMCRIINWDFQSSLLAQGAEMSITYKAAVPLTCDGTFTSGQFYFIGEVI